MDTSFTLGFLFVLLSALVGGYVAKLAKLQPIIGYIIAGVVIVNIFPTKNLGIEQIAGIGAILLLFSIGLEFSLNKFSGIFKKILFAASAQMIIVSFLMFFLFKGFGVSNAASIVLAMGFSLSSTSVVLKILTDKAELDSIHGKFLLGWLLVQDLAVVPMMVSLPFIQYPSSEIWFSLSLALFKSLLLVVFAFILGKHIVPFIVHKVAQTNSRELLLLTSLSLAIGTAYGVTLFGISATLGAFLAGLVISESQENHAVFAETRPLRDLFVAMFFVSLGLFVDLGVVWNNLLTILLLMIAIITLKAVIIMIIALFADIKGKTAVTLSLGLSQVGEFAFVIFSTSVVLGIVTADLASIVISASLLSLIVTPFIFRSIIPVWRKLRFIKVLSYGQHQLNSENEFSNHIIICGYGRVGGWVGKALESHNIPFVVIEYDQHIVNNLKSKNVPVVYGDPTEHEVLDAAGVKKAKAVVVAIPDRFAQESLITYIQTISPETKIISRVHLDEDWEKLKLLQVDKLVQPEFEAATEIIKSILHSLGRDKESVKISIRNLRLSHAKI